MNRSQRKGNRTRSVPANRSRASHRQLVQLVLAAMGTAALALTGAPPAEAGTFTIGDCPAAAGHPTTAEPWQLDSIDVPSAVRQECSAGAGDWIGLAGVENGPILEAVAVDTHGTPLTILHARLWWRAFGPPTGNATAEIVAYNTHGPTARWAQPDAGAIWDTTAGPQEVEYPASENVELLRVGQECTRPYGTTTTSCPTQNQFTYDGLPLIVQLFGAELTLLDNTPPTVTVTTAPEARGPLTGSISIGFHATDPVGVRKSELLVDGTPVASHNYRSSCSYTQLRPCPESESDQLAVEGASLPEGAHQLVVRVEDAAGNTSLSPSRTVTSARPPVPNGNPCPTPTITVTLAGKSPVPYGKPAAVRGRLACGAIPIAGARVDVISSTLGGAHAANLGATATTADGSFTYPVSLGPSRRLTFTYTAYSNQTAPTAQAALTIPITPKITLQITPRRTHNHRTITWRGHVLGGPYPAGGITLLTQVLNVTVERVRRHHRWKTVKRREWLTFHEIVAHHGKIAYHWTFRHTSRPTIYTFRVATPTGGAAGYEYAPAASNPVSVRVG
jgi:Bacterial Ig domain